MKKRIEITVDTDNFREVGRTEIDFLEAQKKVPHIAKGYLDTLNQIRDGSKTEELFDEYVTTYLETDEFGYDFADNCRINCDGISEQPSASAYNEQIYDYVCEKLKRVITPGERKVLFEYGEEQFDMGYEEHNEEVFEYLYTKRYD